MTNEEMIAAVDELEELVKEISNSVTGFSLSSIRRTLKDIPRIIELSFKLTKTIVKKVHDLENKSVADD